MTAYDRFGESGANGSGPEQRPPAEIEVSVVIPCLNEAECIAEVVTSALTALEKLGVTGEVLVVDNASTDDTAKVAAEAGARIVLEPTRGYGAACRAGLENARGQFLVLGDGDGTYDFGAVGHFVDPLRNGADVVMGSRLLGTMEDGAMPWLHRRVGNPFLSWMINWLFAAGISDAHCGLRSIKRVNYEGLVFNSTGMEFASEFVIEATRSGARFDEVPINYRRRAGGEPKLRTFRDGWRHVRLMVARRTQQTMSRRRRSDADRISQARETAKEPA